MKQLPEPSPAPQQTETLDRVSERITRKQADHAAEPIATMPSLAGLKPLPSLPPADVAEQEAPLAKEEAAVESEVTKQEKVAVKEEAAAPGEMEPSQHSTRGKLANVKPSLLPEPVLATLPQPLRDPVAKTMTEESSAAVERLREFSNDDRIAIMPIPSLESGDAIVPSLTHSTPSVTLHTARLLELAQHSIVKSQQSLLRGATHTARKHAISAMQAIVAMRDAQEGGNLHSQQLDHAFDAIRESKDFCGEFGNIDSNALRRMVTVHETAVLKQQDLSVTSSLEATESYLDYAREQLVFAAGGVREGSQALVLLGQIEFQMAKPSDTHSTSVAVTVQQAAVEADPYFAVGYRVLGTTMLQLGMAEEAANCLITSLQIQPTRLAYERLLDVARRLGDVDTARICMKSLEDPRMEEGNLVHSLSPTEFAATHRPAPASIEPSRSSANTETVKAQAKPAARIGFGSLFPFGRR